MLAIGDNICHTRHAGSSGVEENGASVGCIIGRYCSWDLDERNPGISHTGVGVVQGDLWFQVQSEASTNS